MKTNGMKKLLQLLQRLEDAKIWFRLSRNRHDAVSVEVVAPGERWEIDFMEDGSVDVERFRSNGHIDDESVLDELFALCNDEASSEQAVIHHESTRK